MASLAEIAARIAAKKKAHSELADEYGERLDAIDKKEPAVFAHADHVMKQTELDLSTLEKEMQQLANLPLNGSEPLDDALPRSSEVAHKQGNGR